MMFNQSRHGVSPVVAVALAALVCLGTIGDSSAGSVLVYSAQAERTAGSDRQSIARWLSCLGRAVRQARGDLSLIAITADQRPICQLASPAANVCLCLTALVPNPPSVPHQMTDLPPPHA